MIRFVPGLRVRLLGKIRGLPIAVQEKVRQESEDLLQEVMSKGMQGLDTFEYRGPGSVLVYLTQILQNECLNRLEFWKAERRGPFRERRRSGSPDSTSHLDSDIAAGGPGPLTLVGLSDQQARVAEALATLEPRDQEILYLRFFGGASWNEIVDEIGGSSATAASKGIRCHPRG